MIQSSRHQPRKKYMAHLPSFEEILTEIHFRLGLEAKPNKERFTGYGLPMESHIKWAHDLLLGIYEALELDDQSRQDATFIVEKLAGILKEIELNTWTGTASHEQVLWHTLACIHVPIWARNLASWSLANVDHGLPPPDAGMPGGAFWFLPTGDSKTGQLKLPLTKVIEWLLDLLGVSSVESLRDAIGNKNLREKEGGNDSAIRLLRNWLAGKDVPKSADKVREIFPDDAALKFDGAFVLEPAGSPEEQFESTWRFVVDHKNISLEQLADEIPMKAERLRPIYDGSASEKEKAEFVRHVAIRYAAPNMATVRQRLRVARLAQAGYKDLVKFLCPEIEKLRPDLESDPRHNKVLQLIALFETVYNKTVEAWHYGDEQAQDAWFEKQFAPWDCYDLLLSVLPSVDWDERVYLLSERLTRRFLTLSPEQGLEDILPVNEEDVLRVLEHRIFRIKQELDEDKRVEQLRDRVRAGSPYRALQAESSYWVLNQFVQMEGLSDDIRRMTMARLRELASTSFERGSWMLHELGFLLNGEARKWPKDIRVQVKVLLEAAQADAEAWECWKAPLLRFRAKHACFENRMADAEADFKAALEACSERSYGGMRGEIARDGFATAVVRGAFNPKNHEIYYRNMLNFMKFPNGVPSFEDAAAECEEIFWSTLYQPYPDVESFAGPGRANTTSVWEETSGMVEEGDWEGLKQWMSKNAKRFRKDDLKAVRRDSLLMLWLKLFHEHERMMPTLRAFAPPTAVEELRRIDLHMKHRREACRLLIETWPEQASIADFKKQTPLMLVADNADAELTNLLIPHSDINAQDYLGRTALHAAVAGRSSTCLEMILSAQPDVLKVSEDEGNTGLHTAVRFAWLVGVQQLLEAYPGLAGQKNIAGQTPLEMARELLSNYEAWQEYMQAAKRHIGSQIELEKIVVLLASQTIH